MRALCFRPGFLWGTSTAGHQIEGWNEASDWWEWEKKGLVRDGTVSGAAVDYWHRYEEDHALMSGLGYQAFRLGIEWSKIEPRRGFFSDERLEHYVRILGSLRRSGIRICLTLNHWVLPRWVAAQGDWLNPVTVDDFERFAVHVVERLKEYPDLWVTLNEPMVPAVAGNLFAQIPPGRASLRACRRVAASLLDAHARLYRIIHERVPRAPGGEPTQVGVAQAYPWIEPWGSPGLPGLYERAAARVARLFAYEAWDGALVTGRRHFIHGGGQVDGLRGSCDYCGVNYYFRLSLRYDRRRGNRYWIDEAQAPPGVETTQMGWQVHPEGLYRVLKMVWERFGKPIYVTENGVADDADTMRPRFLLLHLAAVHRALSEGVPVKGYFQWSFVDNYEWAHGFAKKFGLVAVDAVRDPQLRRVPRPSARMYSEIIRENAITEDIVRRYAPQVAEVIFRGIEP